MKMRFWQKTYLFTLSLFLICLNVGILSLTVYTYRKNVAAAEATASAEQYYIALSFERDYADLVATTPNGSPSLLMQSFGTYYSGKGLFLAFEDDGDVLYTNFTEDFDMGKNTLQHRDLEGKRHIVISSPVCGGKYEMIFGKNVEELNTEFRSLLLVYVLTAAGISLLLATALYFILKKLSDPLEKLRRTTEKIEAGDFSATAEERGNDEFTRLAKSFNLMLSKINEHTAALEEEARQKQMLVDNMAHELRTPLTSIHGYAEYLEKANTTEERRLIAAKYILSESERLSKISEILLDSAYIRENRVPMAELDLAAVLSDTAEKLQMKASQKEVTILCKAQPMQVQGSETLLSMLFYNLTENAVKACAPGGTVKLSCGAGAAVVEDNGKGMTKEQLSHITEPFYRTDKSRSRAEGGAGLGLALCRQIARTHGAEMKFESEPGEGTKVFLTFTSRQ